VTLNATDSDGDALAYAIVSGPTNGSLSGTLPNLTYTPDSDYEGADSFTYKANDGYADSNIATVSITVTPPNLVFNGDFESGYANGWNHRDADNGASATFSDETESPQQGSHALKVDILTLGGNPWNVQSLGPNLNLVTGDEYTLTFWARAASENTAFKVVFQNTQYDGYNFTLETKWKPYSATFTAKEDAPEIKLQFPELGTVWVDDVRVTYNNTLPQVSAGFDETATLPDDSLETTVDLNGTASDADGQSLASTWTVESGPAAVSFGNASSVETTATFTQAGTYVLRLTADDGYDQSFDEVEIVILEDTDSDGMPDAWESVHGFNASINDANLDSDSDGLSNYHEYLAGTDPNDPSKLLEMVSITFGESGERIITWNSDQDGTTRQRRYTLQRSLTLKPSDWEDLYIEIPPSGATTQAIDSDGNPDKVFYRIGVK
jgi:hypothetical protein